MTPAFALASLLIALAAAPAMAAAAPAATTAAAEIPADLLGAWRGRATHEGESADFGLDLSRHSSGRVLARVWMPNLNAYGSAIGWVTPSDSGFQVAEAPASLIRRADGSLTGFFYQPALRFEVRRTDSLSRETPPPTAPAGPAPAWSYRARGPLWASPVTAAGTAFVGDTTGLFHAVSVATGRALWTFEAGEPLFGEARVADRSVFVLGEGGTLFKLDRFSGELRWKVSLAPPSPPRTLPSNEAFEWDFAAASPVVEGPMLYVGTADGVLHALRVADGKEVWTFKTGGKIRCSARVHGNRVYVGSLDHHVYALDRASGREVWKFDTGSAVTSTPEVIAGRVVIGTRDQATLYGLDAATGRLVWKHYFWLSWVESSARAAHGLVCIGSSDSRRVRVLEPATGRLVWSSQVWGWTWGTPLVVGERVYFATAGTPQYFVRQSASLGCLDWKTGALLWRRPIPSVEGTFLTGFAGSLAYAEGRVIAAGVDGTLIAFPAR